MSYGRIHRSFFDSSINEADSDTRLVFVAAIVLSDRSGRLDMTVEAFARRVNLPVESVRRAFEALSAPDASSRTPDHEGRRIIPIDPMRPWGWIVVNKEQYRKADGDDEAIRADARERKRQQREREKHREERNSSFTKEESNTKETSLIQRDSHARVTPRHAQSQNVTSKCDAIFNRCWALVPRKEGRKEGRKHFDAEVRRATAGCKSEADFDAALGQLARELEAAVRNYREQIETMKTEPRFVMHGSTLFYNFRDYIERRAATRRRSRAEGLQGVAL